MVDREDEHKQHDFGQRLAVLGPDQCSCDFDSSGCALVVCLGCAYERNPSIGPLADMPRGWAAWRDSPDGPWTREPKDPESNEHGQTGHSQL